MKKQRVKIRKFFELPEGINRQVDVNKQSAASAVSEHSNTIIDSVESETAEQPTDGKELEYGTE